MPSRPFTTSFWPFVNAILLRVFFRSADVCLVHFFHDLPERRLVVVRLQEARADQDADPEKHAGLRAKTKHFRNIMQVSIAVGKESTAGGSSTAGGPQPGGGPLHSI